MQYFHAVCEERGWSAGGISRHERREDSGTFAITKTQMVLGHVVWERKRGGAMRIRARSESSEAPLSELQACFDQITAYCTEKKTQEYFLWNCLEYEGLPWRGELWLSDKVRLGPPSRQYEKALIGPRAILVSALIQGVTVRDAQDMFQEKLQEICAFLSVVTRQNIVITNPRQTWTWEPGAAATIISSVRNIGYTELEGPAGMADRGPCSAVPLYAVSRPDNELRGIDGTQSELALPEDIIPLWDDFRALNAEQRRKFLQIAARWQEALMHSRNRETLSFSLMVIACEALKPSDRQFDDHRIDDVVGALLGEPTAAYLKEDWFRAHHVRSMHVHQGELRGSEFQAHSPIRSFYDPTFDIARRELARITNAAIIEWLRRRGTFPLPPITQPWRMRRWIRNNAFILFPIIFAAGLAVGWLVCAIRGACT
jgi:hypothetical protein